jgi:hypothetical protein
VNPRKYNKTKIIEYLQVTMSRWVRIWEKETIELHIIMPEITLDKCANNWVSWWDGPSDLLPAQWCDDRCVNMSAFSLISSVILRSVWLISVPWMVVTLESISLITTVKSFLTLFDSVHDYYTSDWKHFYIWIIIGFSSFKWYKNHLSS